MGSALVQARELQKGCDVLVATPGRLNHFIERGLVSLSHVRHMILDEADRMLDMGFESQIRQITDDGDLSKSGDGLYKDLHRDTKKASQPECLVRGHLLRYSKLFLLDHMVLKYVKGWTRSLSRKCAISKTLQIHDKPCSCHASSYW